MTTSHIAELNIARPRFPLDDPRMADFMTALDRVNALAERSPGFVWRLVCDGSEAATLDLPGEADAIVNLSVWQDTAALKAFVFQTVHKRFLTRRAEWFAASGEATFVMWPVAPGHQPSLLEAAERLARLRREGPSPAAYGWRALFDDKEQAA